MAHSDGSHVHIRDSRPQDDRRLAELAVESMTFHADSFADIRSAPEPTVLVPEFAPLRAAPECCLRVAEVDGRLVGYLTAHLRPAPDGGLERFDGPTVYVADVAVTRDARGHGVASQLMRDLEQWAVTRGSCAITLSVHSRSTARRFYEKLEYTPTWATYRKNLWRPSTRATGPRDAPDH